MKVVSMDIRYILVAVLAVMILTGAASAKSVYVIDDINSNPTPISAYDIQASGIVYQTTNTVPYYGWGAVGLAVDTDSAYLFVTYESSNQISIVNATTMMVSASSPVEAPGASNLAGIVVDQDKQKVYAVDRHTNHLYVYAWDPVATTLTLEGGSYLSLANVTDAYGIALDETTDLLYVASANEKKIAYYDTATWTFQGSFTVTPHPMGVAIDASNGWVYSGGWSDAMISKYDFATDTEVTHVVGGNAEPIGFAVDPATSNLFVTTYAGSAPYGDVLLMYDSDLNELDRTGDIGSPTGVCVPGKDISFNPLNMAKTDGVTMVLQGGMLTYTISYDNAGNNNPVDAVAIVDTLPAEVNYVSSTNSGVYDAVNHTVTWNIGTLEAGAPEATVSVTVTVDPSTPVGTMLDNAATIDSEDTAPTTQHDDDTEVIWEIPEFPTIALPIAAILGLAFLFVRRRDE